MVDQDHSLPPRIMHVDLYVAAAEMIQQLTGTYKHQSRRQGKVPRWSGGTWKPSNFKSGSQSLVCWKNWPLITYCNNCVMLILQGNGPSRYCLLSQPNFISILLQRLCYTDCLLLYLLLKYFIIVFENLFSFSHYNNVICLLLSKQYILKVFNALL